MAVVRQRSGHAYRPTRLHVDVCFDPNAYGALPRADQRFPADQSCARSLPVYGFTQRRALLLVGAGRSHR